MGEPRRPGRPPLPESEKPARVHVSLSPKAYDRAQTVADKQGVSVPELMRRSLARALTETDEPE